MLIMQDKENYDVDICVFHVEIHAIKCCPSLPRLKEFYQEDNRASQSPKLLCYVVPRGPWHPIQPSIMQEPNS